MAHLQVFIAASCPVCVHSRQLAAQIAERFPQVDVELIDIAQLDEDELPEAVFATPTWLWDGHLYSLGNPDPAKLWRQLAASNLPQSPTPFEEYKNGREDETSVDNGIISRSI